MNYQYPIDTTWSREEIVDVVHFFTMIEKAYEQKVKRGELLAAYRKLKQVIPSKAEEKRIFAKFEKDSGYSSYRVVKKARDTEKEMLSMQKGNAH